MEKFQICFFLKICLIIKLMNYKRKYFFHLTLPCPGSEMSGYCQGGGRFKDTLKKKPLKSIFWGSNGHVALTVYKSKLFLTQKCKKIFFVIIFFIKPIVSIIYELCQHLGSLGSLWKAPETKTLRIQSKVNTYYSSLKVTYTHLLPQIGLISQTSQVTPW